MNRLNRLNFFDVMRAFTIFLVIIMHTAMAYLGFSNWVHVAPSSSLLGIVVVFAESGVWMPILFFISGYFTLSSLQKRGPAEFMKDKLLRLGVPFLIGLTLLSPVLWLMGYYANGGSLPLAQALASFFTQANFSQFHFWYLGMLLLYFALVALACKWFPSLLKVRPAARQPSALFFIALIAITSALCFGVNLFVPYGDWTTVWVLQFQSVKVPLYNTYFLLGIFAWWRGWFKDGFPHTTGGFTPRLWPWALIYAFSFIFYLGLADRFNGVPTSLIGKLLMNITASIEVLSALMTFSALFQKLCSVDRPILRSLASLSFATYIVHLNVLFVVLLLTRDLALPVLLKYALQAGLTVSISWMISWLWRAITTMVKTWRPGSPQVLQRR